MLARTEPPGLRVNVGCGDSPTPGWVNIDNSPSVRLAALPWLWPLLPRTQREFAKAARDGGVQHGSATRLNLPAASAAAIYSSHMVEHLDRAEARAFLAEARRALKPGGVLRLVLPDLRRYVDAYKRHGDADAFVASTMMGTARPRSIREWFRYILTGPRHHLWMYDGPSLARLLADAGYRDVQVLPPGRSSIVDPGALNLRERADESVYVEGRCP